jgi:hypothetical protein
MIGSFFLLVVVIAVIHELYDVQLRFYGPGLLILGGLLGERIGSRLETFRDDLENNPGWAGRLRRRVFLTIGLLLLVVNILPTYEENTLVGGGGYSWSTFNSVLAGIGAVFTVLAFATKRNDEDF